MPAAMPQPETQANADGDLPPEVAPTRDDDWSPGEASLCEACGYALRGLPATGDCPECGKSIVSSSPRHRTGLPWQNRIGVRAWLQTARLVAFSPRRAFTIFPADASRWHARLFLLLIALGTGAIWYAYWRTASGIQPLKWGLFAFGSLILLTYIEAVGVTYFSKRRGWRMPMRLAEQIACYSAVGWIPASLVLLKVFMWHMHPAMSGPFDLFKGDARDLPWMVSIGAMSILWFEWLVWFGCGRLKYANSV